jgi:hypothetical protein
VNCVGLGMAEEGNNNNKKTHEIDAPPHTKRKRDTVDTVSCNQNVVWDSISQRFCENLSRNHVLPLVVGTIWHLKYFERILL